MKNYKTGFLLLFVIVLGGYAFGSSTTDKIIFLNTGKMYVGTSGHSSLVSLYIPLAYRDANNSGIDSVNIELGGYMELGGNFYHDATFQGFRVTPEGYSKAKSGVFRFSGNHGSGARRYVTTFTSDSLTCTSFNRGNYYLSFPNIILDSNDTLIIPARMGIDATTFKRGTTNTGGSLVLRSDKIGTYDYDASLRITGSGSSASLVDAGSVIVEREMSLYRYGDGTTPALFPFATPFKNTQLSGYFAGNWVRRPLADGEMGSTTYLFANKDNNPADNFIDMDQYVYMAAETLVPAQAYLIKPRPSNYSYANLQTSGGLWYTGATASAYDKGKFSFNGKVYTVTPYQEQLFAEDVLTSKSASGTPLSTVNWLIGNSYTCPISTAELARAMEMATGLTFSSTAYVYLAGSQSYQPITVSGTGSSITVSDYTEIPAMSIFLLTLKGGNMQNGSISIGKELQRHGQFSHGAPNSVRSASGEAPSTVQDQVNFRIYPSDNTQVYDLAAIGLRKDATQDEDNYDIPKFYSEDNSAFQIYSLSASGAKLAANGVPLNTDTVQLYFKAPSRGGNFIIEATNTSTLSSEGAWLLDKFNNTLVDLKEQPQYNFTSAAGDQQNRFRVYFQKPQNATTGTDNNLRTNGLFSDNTLILKNLNESDANSLIRIYDVQGRVLSVSTVNTYPEFHLGTSLPQGVYVIQMKGRRNLALKVVKSK